jgi:hypothetical protein
VASTKLKELDVINCGLCNIIIKLVGFFLIHKYPENWRILKIGYLFAKIK